MKSIALVFLIVLVTAMVPGTVDAAEPPTIYPGMGGAPVEVLTNMHPTVKGNTIIMDYIQECGVGNWHEGQMDADFKSAHLAPANSCGKQLVFSIRKSAGRDDPTQITTIWIIDANETWSDSMDPVYPSVIDYRAQGLLAGIRSDPVFVVVCTVIALGLLAILFRMMRRKG
ncbi:MAG: hypothetical protein M0Q92_15880 [Methanoregula sp.]|jgi:hypothetical protein|nr:hypothetical protein [Methanoregula sp.]